MWQVRKAVGMALVRCRVLEHYLLVNSIDSMSNHKHARHYTNVNFRLNTTHYSNHNSKWQENVVEEQDYHIAWSQQISGKTFPKADADQLTLGLRFFPVDKPPVESVSG